MMKKNKSQSGFTLIEMAIVILIFGLITGAVFGFMAPQMEQKKQQVTKEKELKIARALSDFAQQTGTLPCPAAPDGSLLSTPPLGSVPVGGCSAGVAQTGIVPFRVLGLTQEDAIDGYSNPFTYVIPAGAAITSAANIHNKCRVTTTWIDSGNKNPPKASFCCKQMTTANQIKVYAATPFNTANQVVPTGTGTPSGEFAADSVTATSTTTEIRYISYVLISHGKNGAGSYTILANPVTSARKPTISGNTAENENADDDIDFTAYPRSAVPGADFFDDIVLWRTQDSVISETSSNSCFNP